MSSPYGIIALVSCDACFAGDVGRRIRWWCSFSHLTQGQVNFISKSSNFETQNIPFKNMLIVSSFVLGIQNVVCFDVGQLEMSKIAFQKSHVTFTWFFGHCKSRK